MHRQQRQSPSPPAHNTKQTHLHANNPHNDKGSTSTAAAPSNHQSHNDSGQSVISTSNTTYQPPDPFVLINDGTQRLTIRWSPDSFDTLANDQSAWDHTLTATLHQLFQAQISRIAAVKWGGQYTPTNNTPLSNIPPDKIRNFLSPNISLLKTNKTFIFGLRLSAPDNHLNGWITHASTRDILRANKMEITLSNSKSCSGNVVTAGYILMKHPTYTQRYFYLLSLRKALPTTTPFSISQSIGKLHMENQSLILWSNVAKITSQASLKYCPLIWMVISGILHYSLPARQ
jgi:hypothetical protein